MKTTTSLFLGAAMIASTLLVAAPQTSEPTAFGVIRGDQVLSESNIGRQAREQLQAAISRWEERIGTATQELEQLNQRRAEQGLTLSSQALSDLDAQIQEKQVEISRMRDDANREVQRLQQQMSQQVNAQLVPIVDRFAEEQGLELILDASQTAGLLYFDPAKDYTDQFLATVNAELGGAAQDGDQP